jgi:hypothetical protein
MSIRHLSCPTCRIRVRADAREITLLEGRCPICGAMLRPVPSASDVMGFRSFDLDSFSEQVSDDQPNPAGNPAIRRKSVPASARDDLDADRWSDDGGNMTSEAVTVRYLSSVSGDPATTGAVPSVGDPATAGAVP